MSYSHYNFNVILYFILNFTIFCFHLFYYQFFKKSLWQLTVSRMSSQHLKFFLPKFISRSLEIYLKLILVYSRTFCTLGYSYFYYYVTCLPTRSAKTYLELNKTTRMDIFAEIGNGSLSLIVFAKTSALGV